MNRDRLYEGVKKCGVKAGLNRTSNPVRADTNFLTSTSFSEMGQPNTTHGK